MRVQSLQHIINGSGHDVLEGITVVFNQTFDLPEDKAIEAQKRGLVRLVIDAPESESPPPAIETTAAPAAPERALSRRGTKGRFVKPTGEGDD